MAFEGEIIETDAQELLALENKKLTEEVKNLKQLVADMYIAMTTGQVCPSLPVGLLDDASTVLHQAKGPTAKDLQYSPDSPYYGTTDVMRPSTMCPPALPLPPKRWCASPLVSVPPSAGLDQKKSFENKEGKEGSPEMMDEKRYKQTNSCPRISQKHHSKHYPLQNQRHFIPLLQKAWPYDPKDTYPQWRAPAPHLINPIHQAPQNQFQTPPNILNRPRGSGFRPRAEYKKMNQEKKNEFTPIGESYAGLFQKLQALDMLRPINGGMYPRDRIDDTRQCAYHSGAQGHDTEDCHYLKKDIQALIDNGQIQIEGSVNQDPSPVYSA